MYKFTYKFANVGLFFCKMELKASKIIRVVVLVLVHISQLDSLLSKGHLVMFQSVFHFEVNWLMFKSDIVVL